MPRSPSHSSPRARGDHGKETVLKPSRSGGRSHGKGRGRGIEEGAGYPLNAYNAEREAGVHREIKTEHWAPRLITIIVKIGTSFVSLSETKQSRGASDAGAVLEKNKL